MRSAELALLPRFARAAEIVPAQPFDYADLPTEDTDLLRGAADQIRLWQKATASHIILSGRNLNGAKKMLGHGRFSEWVSAEFGWTLRTAENYMRVADAFSAKSETVSHLPATALYQLASPSTPEPVRAAVVERLERGERVPVDAIREMVADARHAVKREREIAKLSPRRQKLIRRTDEERAEAQEKWERESERQDAARQAAARLIVKKVGNDLPELLRLLKVASHPGLHASDIEAAAATAAV